MTEEFPSYVDEYLRLVLRKQKDAALSFLRELADSKKLPLILLFDILAASQHTVGTLWSNGTITVADEHYATEVVLEAIDMLSSKFKVFRKQSTGSALVANFVEGEYHTVGLEMFARLLKSQGWDVELLSVPLNISALFKQLENSRKRFDLICCSVTMEFNIEDLVSVLKILRTNINTRDSIILVGSQLFLDERVTDQIIDRETQEPLADFLAKTFDDGMQFIQGIIRH